MKSTLIILAEFHYEFGFIGFDEFRERIDVAMWLSDKDDRNDPRLDSEEEPAPNNKENREDQSEPVISRPSPGRSASDGDEENRMMFLCLGVWVFTKADRDSYPSIPHGHYGSQHRAWPKLNPYTGRVFSSKHQEDKTQRLSKKEMKEVWRGESFKSFCREMIVWYQEQFPYYDFSVRRPLRMPRW